MSSLVIVYGSTYGNTAEAAESIAQLNEVQIDRDSRNASNR